MNWITKVYPQNGNSDPRCQGDDVVQLHVGVVPAGGSGSHERSPKWTDSLWTVKNRIFLSSKYTTMVFMFKRFILNLMVNYRVALIRHRLKLMSLFGHRQISIHTQARWCTRQPGTDEDPHVTISQTSPQGNRIRGLTWPRMPSLQPCRPTGVRARSACCQPSGRRAEIETRFY